MKSKLWLIIVVVLLLVNTVVLAMLWLKRPTQSPPPGANAKEFLVKELGLTAEQQNQFDSLREDHQESIRDIMDGMKELKDSFFNKVSESKLDSSAVNELATQIGEKEKQRDLATLYHFRAFRTILTGRQQNRFDSILKDVMRMMGGPQRPPQGPPPGSEKR